MEKGEFEAGLKEWVAETEPLIEGFKSLFPGTTEGFIKYLFALNYAVMGECLKRGIPEEAFHRAVPIIVSAWFAADKPEGVELLCISGDWIKEILECIRAKDSAEGPKPSSNA